MVDFTKPQIRYSVEITFCYFYGCDCLLLNFSRSPQTRNAWSVALGTVVLDPFWSGTPSQEIADAMLDAYIARQSMLTDMGASVFEDGGGETPYSEGVIDDEDYIEVGDSNDLRERMIERAVAYI